MTYFNDIKFENNTFEKIDRTGINFAYNTNDTYDPAAVDGYKNRYNSNVVIRNNSFNDIGGDGIITIGCNSPLIEYNVLSLCRNRTTQASVAIFPWQCTNSLIQYNEAYLTQATDTHGDGQAFDCDYGNDGTTYQYNYSHDNEGGFMLLCSTGDASPPDRCYNSIVRYNISENDGMRTFRLCGPGTRFSRIYNNTIYLAADIDGEVVQNESWNGLAGETTFENNIFYILNDNEENPENVWTGNSNAKFHTSELFIYDNNSYYGVEAPTGVYGDANKITGDPKFVSPGGADIGMATCEAYKLQAGSSCIDTGKVIAGNGGGLDFFGNVLYNGTPDIGAHEFGASPYIEGDPLPEPTLTEWVPNGEFETGDSISWDFNPNAAVVNSDFHGGAYCAKIGGEWNGISRTVNNLQPNTTYTMIIWGKVESASAPLELGVQDYGGEKKTHLVTSSIYEQVLITFTTGENNTSALIYAYNGSDTNEPGKNGYVDDIRIAKSKQEVPQQVVKELVSNRGFETGLMSPWSGYGIYSIDNSDKAYSGDYCVKVEGSSGNTGIEQVINNLLPNTAYTLTLWGKMENTEDSMVVGVADFGGTMVQDDVDSTSYEQLTFNFTTGASNTSAKIFVWKGSNGLGFADDFSIVGPTSAPQEVSELAYDRSFESGSLTSWETHGDVAELINTNARTGNYCIRVVGDEGAGSGVRQTVHNLLPNTPYTLSGWIKIENEDDVASIGVKNYNTSVGYDQIANDVYYASGDYGQVSINFTTGPNDTSALIFGYKWYKGNSYYDDFSLIGPTTATKVSGVSVTGTGGSNTITAKNGTLQLQAVILPTDATNKAVVWSVANGTGSAIIDASGLLTAVADGTVLVKAAAQDGSDVEGTAEVTISGQTVVSGGNTTPASTSTPAPTPTPSALGTLKVEAKLDANGKAKVELKASDIAAAIDTTKGNIVTIEVKPVVGAKEVEVNIPAQQLSAAEEKHVESIKVDTGLAVVTIPLGVFEDSISGASSNVRLSVAQIDSTSLSEKVKQVVGGNKVYDFNLSIDGNKISNFKSGGKATNVEIAVDYTLKEGEDPGKVVVYYVDDSGKLEVVNNGRYDPTTGKVIFKVKHFSKYTAVYTAITFMDAKKIPWAKEGIETLAARGIIDTATLEAEKNVTRAEFIYMLMDTLDLVDETSKCSFKDVKEGSKYYTAISTAQKLGISAGYKNGSFGVNDEISRQDMAVMLYKTGLIIEAKLNSNVKAVDFADKTDISTYAIESVTAIGNTGIMVGVGKNKFEPKAKASIAQAVVVIYSLFELT